MVEQVAGGGRVDAGVKGSGLSRAAKAPLGMVLLLGSLTAFGPVSTDMYLPSLPQLAKALHATDAAAQQTVSAFFIGIAVGQLAYGPLSDRFGRRPPLLFGICLYLLATVGCALAHDIQTLLVFRVLQALGGCAGMVIARAAVRDRFAPEEVLHVFAMLMLVMGLAPILAPLLGGLILLVGDWRWIFWVQAFFALCAGIATLTMLGESRSAETAAQARRETPFHAYAALLGNRRLVGYLFTGAFSGAALFTYVASSPAVVIGYFHIPAQAFGWVFGLNSVGFIGSAQINARLARRHTTDAILEKANMGLFLVSLALLAFSAFRLFGPLGVLGPLFLIMAGLGFNQTNASAGALNIDPRRSGATAALLGFFSFGIGALASGAAALAHDGTPRPMALVICVSFFLAVISLRVLALGGRRIERRRA